MKNQFNKKQTLFKPADEARDQPLASSQDECAAETSQITTVTRKKVRRVDTSELSPTPKTPTKAK